MRAATLVLFLILDEKLSVFTSEHDVNCELVIYGYHFVDLHSFHTQFVKSFCHQRVLPFVKFFLCIYWDDNMIISPFIMVYHVYWFDYKCQINGWFMLNHPCISWINSTWSWYMILFNVLLILFASIFVEDFCIYVHQGYWPVLFFSSNVLFWSWYQVILVL